VLAIAGTAMGRKPLAADSTRTLASHAALRAGQRAADLSAAEDVGDDYDIAIVRSGGGSIPASRGGSILASAEGSYVTFVVEAVSECAHVKSIKRGNTTT
jgi:hypothetical protein